MNLWQLSGSFDLCIVFAFKIQSKCLFNIRGLVSDYLVPRTALLVVGIILFKFHIKSTIVYSRTHENLKCIHILEYYHLFK